MMSSMYRIRLLLILFVTSSTLRADTPDAQEIPKDYVEITCEIKPFNRASRPHTHPPIPTSTRDAQTAATSDNWCGYIAQTDLNKPAVNSVTKVFGSWIVPEIGVSDNTTEDNYSSIWVGIDGSGSPTVEQLGTQHAIIKGKKEHSAWFEMYPEPSFALINFPLEVGDKISASVIYKGNGVFQMQMSNNTKKVYVTVPTEYTKSATAQRLCAEWIVEAPWLNKTLPLTNFGTAYLSSCFVEINNLLGVISNSAWVHESMNMVYINGTVKAIASDLTDNGTAFSVAWKHS